MHSALFENKESNATIAITHLPAALSKRTTGSLRLPVSHIPPKPTKRFPIETGPSWEAPVDFLKTW